MYRIAYIHRGETAENTLYFPGDDTYCLTYAKLALECGCSGELTVNIPEGNPAKTDIICLADEIIVYRDEVEIWRGRPITMQTDFNLTGELTCEGVLSYLYDTHYPPYEFSGSPTDLIQDVLDNHNAQVEEQKQIQLGTVTVEDSNDYISRSSVDYSRSLEVLSEKLVNESLGGYLRVRVVDGVKYLDYLESYGTTAAQKVELGVNLLDLTDEIEYGDVITALIPLGAKLEDSEGNETDEYLTIADVNGGEIYIYDADAVAQYGWIFGTAEWEDVTVASNLLTKAQDYLTQMVTGIRTLTVKAVDLSLATGEETPIELGDTVEIYSAPHGVNLWIELTSMDIYPLDPASNTLTFGTQTASYTGTAATTSRKMLESINTNSTTIRNLAAQIITTEYLAATYATITDLDAVTATINELTADYITAAEIEAIYATIESLDTATANISTLTTEVANINSLLAGNIGAGTVQTIHLSADNTVIDTALIETIYAANGIISDLVAGTIYTDSVQIANNDGQNLWIDGATIQISDGTYVRVQIGEDASGDYNLYLWNANGVLIWDALGLTEAGLTGNGAIIKDAAVADDAAISGYKLDIASVAEYLTTDGSLQVDAAQVIINESTLVAEYVTITTATNEAALAAEAAQALADALASEAVTSITQYYALGDSADEPPCDPADGAERAAATVETAVVGESLVEVTETSSTWTTAYQAPADGEYLWTAFYVVYYDGNAEWTEPTCLTDGVAREKTTTLETELEVVQGQISSKVWQTDIDTAVDTLEGEITTIQDQYTTVTETIEGITTEIGDLTTTVNGDGTTTGLVSRVTTLETTAEGITATVTSVQSQIDNLSIGGRNYALNSGRYTEGDDPAWYLSSTTAEDYFTISVADGYTRIYRDITQSMMCYVWLDLSDAFDSAAEYMVSLRVRLSKAAALALRAYHSSSTNVSISSFDADNFTAGEWVTLSCAFTPDSSYTYQRVGFSLSNFATAGDYIDIAWIKVEQGTVATDWTPAPEDTETIVTSVVSASLALTIETDDDGVAYGCISANADYILFEAGQLIINAGNFTMDEDGNIVANNGTFTGTIYASGGTVGGWNITSTRIKSSSSIYVGAAEAGMLLMNESDRPYIHVQDSNTNTTFQVARDGAVKSSNLTITGGSITLGGVFSVTSAGMLYAKGGAEFDGNLEMYSSIRFHVEPTTGVGISAYFADTDDTSSSSDTRHFVVYRGTDGLTSYFGWSGAGSDDETYASVSILRGRTVRYQNSSGTTTLSDERIKKDWTSLDNWDGFFDRLEPKAFRYIDGNAGRFHIGMGAQTTEQALLDSGLTTQDFAGLVISPASPDEEGNGYHGYDEEYGLIYTEFVGLLIDQVQKLKARVAALEGG